jgi:nicotinate-nucleotide pyrophosphorylase (carboxylating)
MKASEPSAGARQLPVEPLEASRRPPPGPLAPLEPSAYRELVRRALDEDIGAGDITTEATVRPSTRARGVFLAKSACIVAGLDVAFEVFRQVHHLPTADAHLPDPLFRAFKRDGDRSEPGDEIAEVTGAARALLTGERTALNFLQRLSGIATQARQFVEASGGRLTILDTRKTTPTLRALEKYAVRAGGAASHRAGLFDAFLIKDNHIRLAGGVAAAVKAARARHSRRPIEIEAETTAQVEEALDAGADTILVDNMNTADIRDAVARAKGRAAIEISGGVTLERIPELAATGADFVSVGALTHSAPAVDISFEVEPI